MEGEIRRQRTTVVHLETSREVGGKSKTAAFRRRGDQQIVDPNGNDKVIWTTERATGKKAGVVIGLDKTDREEIVAEEAAPVTGRLFEAVLGFVQQADKTFAVGTLLDVAVRLFHQNAFFERSHQECSVDVEMMETEIGVGSQLEDGAKGGEVQGGSKSVREIDSFDLRETFGNPAGFVLLERAVSEVLVLKDPLTLDNAVARFVEDKFPRFGFSEGSHLLVGSDAPIVTIGARPSLAERARFYVTVGRGGRRDGHGDVGRVASGRWTVKVVTGRRNGDATRTVSERIRWTNGALRAR